MKQAVRNGLTSLDLMDLKSLKLKTNNMETNRRKTMALDIDRLMTVARYVTYGTILAALICIFSGESCSLSSLAECLGHARNKGVLGALFCIVCFFLDYLIPLVNFYIIYAIEVSLSVVKPEYQVSSTMTSFLKWGYLIIGVINVVIDIADTSDSIAVICLPFIIAFLVVEVIWVRQLSQKWSKLSPEHRNTANLLRNYVYLLIACVIVGIIGGMISEGVGDFFNYVIAGGIDLYLFYQFSTCYHEMSNVKL